MKNLTTLVAVIAFSTIVFLFTAVNPVCAATFTVNGFDDNPDVNPGDGICNTLFGTCGLRAAVDEANALASSDTINFAASLSGGTITLTVANGGEIQITNNGTLTINGLGANVLTIDGGAGANRIFFVNGATATIRGVTLSGGNGVGGSAVLAIGGTTILEAVVVQGNSSPGNIDGAVNLTGGANHRIANSTFSGNTDSAGCAAFFVNDASLTVVNTTVSGNSTTSTSGGFGTGAICFIGSSSAIFRNTTISGNTAGGTSGLGGGIYIQDSATVNLGNTIVAGNTATAGPDLIRNNSTATFTTSGGNLIGDNSGNSSAPNTTTFPTGNPNANGDKVGTAGSPINPQLGALANNGGTTPTRALLAGSPAINAGVNALVSEAFDQRGAGFPRIVSGVVDIGAFEADPNPSFFVNTVADTNDAILGNGICKDSLGTCSLRAAIQESNALAGNDIINFSPSLLGLTITLDPAKGSLNITTNMVINGLGSGSIFISGGGAVRVFNITGGTININRLTALNGNAGSLLDGGGIYSNGSALTLENVIVRNSTATYGGGIYVRGGSLNMTTSTTSGNNTTDDGGGMLLVDVPSANLTNVNIVSNNAIGNSSGQIFGGGLFSVSSSVTLSDVRILNNEVGNNGSGLTFGGGMAVFGDGFTTTMTNCAISFNRSKTDGGGADFSGGIHRVSGTTFSSNTADRDGGGLSIFAATATVVNSTVSGNTASNFGGGINSYGIQNTILRNVTVAGNTATGFRGGGISNQNNPITLANTIVADNTAPTFPDIDGVINSLGNNLIRNRAGGSGYVASDLPGGTNPLLGALQNNGGATQTRALLTGSPAIDAGNNAQALNTDNITPLTTDQRGTGFPRLVDGNSDGTATVDIGAFEVQLAPTAASVTVGGRVTTSDGRGIRNAFVTITDASGNSRTALTGKFGVYRFIDVAAGETYIIAVRARRFTFASPTQVQTIIEDLTDVDFAANEQSSTTFD